MEVYDEDHVYRFTKDEVVSIAGGHTGQVVGQTEGKLNAGKEAEAGGGEKRKARSVRRSGRCSPREHTIACGAQGTSSAVCLLMLGGVAMRVRRIAGLPQKVESSYCSRPEAPQPGRSLKQHKGSKFNSIHSIRPRSFFRQDDLPLAVLAAMHSRV